LICEELLCRAGCREDGHCSGDEICDVATWECRMGCRNDVDCSGANEICDTSSNVCRTGCREDSECGDEEICDGATSVCRPGCRNDTGCRDGRICEGGSCRDGCRLDVECGSEQICDDSTLVCTSGCRDDDGCEAGRICDDGSCRDGCRAHEDCELGFYCTEEEICEEGCGPDGWYAGITERCPVGQACVPNSCGGSHCDWHCQIECYGWDCHSAPGESYTCFNEYGSSDYSYTWRCRQSCSGTSDCTGDQICTPFTTNPGVPGTYRTDLCALPCETDEDCSNSVDSYGDYNESCICRDDGICRFTETYICYQVSPSYGL
jgi:hypothetical protein